MKQVIFVILDEYADWEGTHLTSSLIKVTNGKLKMAQWKMRLFQLADFISK